MKSTETGVLKKSEVYFSSPSQTAKKIYFYPISAGHFFCVKNYHLIRNNYNSLLITHIINGSFTFVENGKHITAKAGDTVILDCYKPHEYYTDTHFESVWIHVAGANSLDLYREIEKTIGNLIKCRDPEHVKKLLFRIFNGMGGEQPPSELNNSLDIYKIFIELLSPVGIKSSIDVGYDDSMRDIKIYISEHISEKLTVAALAKSSHMSTSHFSRVFKQRTGLSPYDYVLITRMNKAKDMLQKTDMTVASIAYETGFNSESNFIYFFTSNEGITPGKFRKLKF